jgi:hypothetical protein
VAGESPFLLLIAVAIIAIIARIDAIGITVY